MLRRLGVIVLLSGCDRTEHTPVDVQLDVLAAFPSDAEAVRICVTDGPWRRFGATTGRFALSGLYEGIPAEVTVNVLGPFDEMLGVAGPLLVEEGYATVEYTPCADCDRCESSGDTPDAGEPSWTLGVRFEDL